MNTNQGSVLVSIGPIEPMTVSGRDPSLYSNGTRDITEAVALPSAVASYNHDQGGQPRRGGTLAGGRQPQGPGLMEWVLSALVGDWSVSATRENSGGTIRDSYSFRASTEHQADRVYSGEVPPPTQPPLQGDTYGTPILQPVLPAAHGARTPSQAQDRHEGNQGS